jgi:hypothetical protein
LPGAPGLASETWESKDAASSPAKSTLRNNLSTPMLSLESPRLHAIAADFHNAPAPRVILAGIQKKPSALIVPAFV